MQINSLPPVIQNEKFQEKAKTVGAPALLAAGASFIGSKAPKGVENNLKLTKRLSKSAKAGLAAAVVMGLLTLKKEDIEGVKNKASELINKIKPQKKEQTTTEAVSANTEIQTETAPNGAKSPVQTENLPEETAASEGTIAPDNTLLASEPAPDGLNIGENEECENPQCESETPNLSGAEQTSAKMLNLANGTNPFGAFNQ